MRRPISLVITDLDNTVYDWLGAFVPALYAMVKEAAPLMNVSEERLLDDLKAVHQKHGDSEHPFALLETKSAQHLVGPVGVEPIKLLDPAFHAFNRVRKQNLKLYPGVFETLRYISSTRVPIVAYTDARVANCLFRLDHLKIRPFFSRLYSPAHVSKGFDPASLDGFVSLLSPDDRKPNPQTLIDICSHYSVERSSALYVGDSLVRDIYMAKLAGVHSAWAKFGTLYDKALWPQLVRVTHWTGADVERENGLREEARGTEPETTLGSFDDILKFYTFEPPSNDMRAYVR
jgi:FMN phosphatase YigB (HAD superfamily)